MEHDTTTPVRQYGTDRAGFLSRGAEPPDTCRDCGIELEAGEHSRCDRCGGEIGGEG